MEKWKANAFSQAKLGGWLTMLLSFSLLVCAFSANAQAGKATPISMLPLAPVTKIHDDQVTYYGFSIVKQNETVMCSDYIEKASQSIIVIPDQVPISDVVYPLTAIDTTEEGFSGILRGDNVVQLLVIPDSVRYIRYIGLECPSMRFISLPDGADLVIDGLFKDSSVAYLVVENSAAHQYCEKNNLNYQLRDAYEQYAVTIAGTRYFHPEAFMEKVGETNAPAPVLQGQDQSGITEPRNEEQSNTAVITPPWDTTIFTLYPMSTVDYSENRIQSRTGPANSYTGGGAYKTNQITSISAIYQENIGGSAWVYTELKYTKGYYRRLYFRPSNFTSKGNVPFVTFQGYAATLSEETTPLFGPGQQYDYYKDAAISAGTKLAVLHEENDYLFIEFECTPGMARAWVPMEIVAFD